MAIRTPQTPTASDYALGCRSAESNRAGWERPSGRRYRAQAGRRRLGGHLERPVSGPLPAGATTIRARSGTDRGCSRVLTALPVTPDTVRARLAGPDSGHLSRSICPCAYSVQPAAQGEQHRHLDVRDHVLVVAGGGRRTGHERLPPFRIVLPQILRRPLRRSCAGRGETSKSLQDRCGYLDRESPPP